MGHYTKQNSIFIILTVFHPLSPLYCIVQIVIVLALLLALKTTLKPTVHIMRSIIKQALQQLFHMCTKISFPVLLFQIQLLFEYETQSCPFSL